MKKWESTILIRKIKKGSKYIFTKDWGNFKLRKNGRFSFLIGKGKKGEIVKCQRIIEK